VRRRCWKSTISQAVSLVLGGLSCRHRLSIIFGLLGIVNPGAFFTLGATALTLSSSSAGPVLLSRSSSAASGWWPSAC
jgi:hypothetical protein